LGIAQDERDRALDAEDPKAALLELIWAVQKAQLEAEANERAKLDGMKNGALASLARSLGIAEDDYDSALDADNPKAALIELILPVQMKAAVQKTQLEAEAVQMEAAAQKTQLEAEANERAKLDGMSNGELARLARSLGIADDECDKVLDADNPKAAYIQLLLPVLMKDREVPAHLQDHQVDNIGVLKPMQNLETDFAHNPKLVKQYQGLARDFEAWRPVRGDGNCYYRAVIFAWLERSVGLGHVENLSNFDGMLSDLMQHQPMLAGSARICQKHLKAWIAKHGQCKSEADVKALMQEISTEFNVKHSDEAFIQCLRHLVAKCLRENAKMVLANLGLTYEGWLSAISNPEDNIANIDDYCTKVVCVMGEDARDLVQTACPQVLRTFVSIVMVDREAEFTNYFDNDGRMIDVDDGAQPQIYLLFKPGHYDILIQKDDDEIARFLEAPEEYRPMFK